jgi:hypothetical protein
VDWPPLHEGHNEPGPIDAAGEYLNNEHRPGEKRYAAPPGPPARVPGDVRPYEQPLDVASESVLLPEQPEGLTDAERALADPGHVVRGKPSMSSSEGSV